MAQSIFQLGGNAGTAIGPLLVALIVVPNSQYYIIWFVVVAIIGLIVLSRIALWYQNHLSLRSAKKAVIDLPNLSQKKDCHLSRDFVGFDIFKILLHGQYVQLFYVLFNRKIWIIGSGSTISFGFIFGLLRHRNFNWRTVR
ncbi:hypothetical protein [Flavobacterium sp. GNP001]